VVHFPSKFYIFHLIDLYNLKDVHELILVVDNHILVAHIQVLDNLLVVVDNLLVVMDNLLVVMDNLLVVMDNLLVVVDLLLNNIYHKHQNHIVYNRKMRFLYTIFCIHYISNYFYFLKLIHDYG